MGHFEGYLLSLEGGGTRSQAALLDGEGRVLQTQDSIAVNTNFVPHEIAQRAVLEAVQGVLAAAGVPGAQVRHFVTSLVAARFGVETFGRICPNADYRTYQELEVVFARARIYRPHGVGVVAATGATAWGVRADDGRERFQGGWGTLLGDEGSAYAMGLQGLRAAVRAFEERALLPTDLVQALCDHFQINSKHFREELVQLVYQKPLSRTEIAGAAVVVTRLAASGDLLAQKITAKVAQDLAALVLNTAGKLFSAREAFDVVVAGGMVNAGRMILGPLQERLAAEFPQSVFQIGAAAPAEALGLRALHDLNNLT